MFIVDDYCMYLALRMFIQPYMVNARAQIELMGGGALKDNEKVKEIIGGINFPLPENNDKGKRCAV